MLRRFFNARAKGWIGIVGILAVLGSGCGGGSGSGEGNTGKVSFRVQWERDPVALAVSLRAGVDDCLDVDTVRAAVYDTSGNLLQEGGPWNCTDGQGSIGDILAGNMVRVIVFGYSPDGRPLYSGESESFFLAAGVTYNAGTIVAASFVPTLAAPADGVVVAPADLVLRWNAVSGATRYRVTIYSDDDFVTEVQSVSAAAGAMPSLRPDVNELYTGRSYYWRVQAFDYTGNISEFSEGRGFFLAFQVVDDNIPPVALILEPLIGETYQISSLDGFACIGEGSDYEDGILTGSSLQWSMVDLASPGNTLWNGEGEYCYLEYVPEPQTYPGTYRITLVVTDSGGATDTVYRDLTIIFE
jgi:hypothetical protein